MMHPLAPILLAASSLAQEPPQEEVRLWDIVVWTNPAGQKIVYQGTIASQTDVAVEIKLKSGSQFTLKREAIQELKPRNPPEKVYAVKKKKLVAARSREERADLHYRIGLWCVRPLPALDGEPPLPDSAFDHLYKAVQLDPRRSESREAFPHLIDRLARDRESSSGEPSTADLEREVDIYMLAASGGFEDPEIDFRLAEIFHTRLGRTEQAVKLFEKIRAAGGGNHSLGRRARRHLVSIYEERGDREKAAALFEAASAEARDLSGFEQLFEMGRRFARKGTPEDRKRARDHFVKAMAFQPELPELLRELSALDFIEGKVNPAEERLDRQARAGAGDAGLWVDLALIKIERGKFRAALALLDGLLGEAPPPPVEDPAAGTEAPSLPPAPEAGPAERTQAHIARGLVHEYRGNMAVALGEYKKAASLDPSSPTAALLLSGALLQSGDAAGARSLLTSLIKDHAEERGLFAAYARAMADVEIASGQPARAVNLLEYAAEIDPQDPLLRRKIGTLLLGLGEADRAYGHLEAAKKRTSGQDPALLNALGCYHYRRGDFQEAVALFNKVKLLVPRPRPVEGKPPPEVPAERLYAEKALSLAEDALKLEVWIDDFNREASGEAARNWKEVESYGVAVSINEERIVFQGRQANDPSGVTMLLREEPAENVERLSVGLRFEPSSGPVRAGIRLEAADGRGGPPSAGLVFFRDHDGTLGYARRTTRSGWEDAQPTLDTDPAKGKPVFPGNTKWPADGRPHTLTIRKAAALPSSTQAAYDLLLDGKPVAQNVAVEGLRGKSYVVGVSGKVESLDVPYRFEADDFRLYRPRLVIERSRQQ